MKKKMSENEKQQIEEKLKEKTKKAKKNVKKTMEEYKSFAIKGNIIDLAIGMVIGSAFTSIVNSLVNTTITPLISLLTNKVDLSTLFISLSGIHYNTLAEAKEAGAITFNYGELLNSLLNFFIISFTLFLVVKYLNKLKTRTTKAEENVKKVTTKECPYCLSTIPIKATKCAYCTSDILDREEKESGKE